MNKNILIYISYSLFLTSFVFFSYVFVDPNLIYLKQIFTGFFHTQRLLVSSIYFLFMCIFFVFYLYFLSQKIEFIIKIIFLSSIFLFLSYPAMLSHDIFNYMATARVTYFYFENPYVVMPVEFVGDPMLLYTRAANKFALYGPSWIGLTYAPFFVGANIFLLTLFSFKFLVLVFYFLTCYILYKISKNIHDVAFFALNPLVLIETMVSSHNDIIMVFFALFSFFLLRKQKKILSLFMLTISILIKFATLFLLPIWLYIIIKKKYAWDQIWLYSGIAMFIVFLLSPIREEMYPWYSVWFLAFLTPVRNALLRGFIIAFTFGLLLRYLPFMYLGTYFGFTPILRILLTLLPILIYFIYIVIKQKKWHL